MTRIADIVDNRAADDTGAASALRSNAAKLGIGVLRRRGDRESVLEDEAVETLEAGDDQLG